MQVIRHVLLGLKMITHYFTRTLDKHNNSKHVAKKTKVKWKQDHTNPTFMIVAIAISLSIDGCLIYNKFFPSKKIKPLHHHPSRFLTPSCARHLRPWLGRTLQNWLKGHRASFPGCWDLFQEHRPFSRLCQVNVSVIDSWVCETERGESDPGVAEFCAVRKIKVYGRNRIKSQTAATPGLLFDFLKVHISGTYFRKSAMI